MPSPAPALAFPPACLTPLHDPDIRALQALTAGWSPPDPARGTTASTMGPAAYHRLRVRRTAVVAAYAFAIMAIPVALIVTLLVLTDDPALHSSRGRTVFFSFVAGGVVLSLAATAIGWHATGGKRRIAAGTEPATQLTFAATTEGLTITFGTGHRLAGPWSRWRLSQVRSEVIRLRHSRSFIFESAHLVFFPDDGSQSASALLDPITLDKGHAFAATVVAMIARSVHA